MRYSITGLYQTMEKAYHGKFAPRHEVVRYAETHGIREAARRYESGIVAGRSATTAAPTPYAS